MGRYAARARAARPAPRSARRGALRRVRRQGGARGSVDARSSARAARVRYASTRRLHGDVRRGEADSAGVPAGGTRPQSAARDYRRPRQPGAAHQRQRPAKVPGACESSRCRSEIYYRQKALRDAAVGATQRAVANSGAAVYAIGMGTGKGAYRRSAESRAAERQFRRLCRRHR